MILKEARAIEKGEETQVADQSPRATTDARFNINLSSSEHASDDRLARETSDVTVVRTSTQGSKFKVKFFIALFTSCVCKTLPKFSYLIARGCILVVFGFTQISDFDNATYRSLSQLSFLLLWGCPTMLTILSFSVFAYYIAMLNLRIETATKKSHQDPRLSTASRASRERSSVSPKRRIKGSLQKPLFIFCNSIAVLAFAITCLSCKNSDSPQPS